MAKKKMNITMKDPSGRTTAAGRAYFKETEQPKAKPTSKPSTKRKATPVKKEEPPKISFFNKTLASARTLAEKGRRLLDRSKKPHMRTKEA